MSEPGEAAVRATFIDFWPDLFISHSPPFQKIGLSPKEYEAVKRMHRAGPWSLFDCALAKNIAGRVSDALEDFGGTCFVRLSYGSWAPRQMAALGRLTVESHADVARLLTLRDRRLAEIAHRYVRGTPPMLIVRQFIDAALQDEVRILVQNRFPVLAWQRHHPHGCHSSEACVDLSEIEQKIPLHSLARHCPDRGTYTLDMIRHAGIYFLIDVNPYFAPQKS